MDIPGVEMTGPELAERLAQGKLDLRGVDLSGADLSNLDLGKVRCGLTWSFRLLKIFLHMVVGVLAGCLFATSGGMVAFFFARAQWEALGGWWMAPGSISGAVLLAAVIGFLRRGFSGALALALAGAFAVALALALALPGAFAIAIAFALAVAGAFAGALAGALVVALAGAGAGAGALAGALAGTGAGALALARELSDMSGVIYWPTVGVLLTAVLIAARRARAGDPHHASLRNLSIWFGSLWGTKFCGANLSGAVFAEADLNGADFTSANLTCTFFAGAKNLDKARFSKGPLRHVPLLRLLQSGNGEHLDLSSHNLSDLALCKCNLRGANLSGANLRGTNFRETDLLAAANLNRAQIDVQTYSRSHFSPTTIQVLTGVKKCRKMVKSAGARSGVVKWKLGVVKKTRDPHRGW